LEETSLAALPAQPRAISNQASSTNDRAEPQARVEFVAVTQSDELLEALGQALDGESAIRHADTIEAARELIQSSQPCVVMLDARELAQTGSAIEQLQPANGLSVIVVFAQADQTSNVAQAIKRSATFAVLPIPLETAKTAAVLEGARDEVLSRRNVMAQPQQSPNPSPARHGAGAVVNRPDGRESRSGSISDSVTVKALPSTGGLAARRGPPRALIVGGIAAGVLVAIAAAWVVLRDNSDEGVVPEASAPVEEPATTPAAGQPPDASVTGSAPAAVSEASPAPASRQPALLQLPVDELLDRARIAFRDRRYTDPEKDNALLYYQSVLKQEPDNGEALEGLTRIGGLLDSRLQSAMAQQDHEEAAATLARLKLIKPGDAQLKATEAKLAEARIASALEKKDVDRAAVLLRQASQGGVLPPERLTRLREDVERRQADARTQRLGELVSLRIREGRLVEPENDSAKFHLAQLRKTAGDSRRTASATRELENAYLKRARDAAAAKQTAEYERWVEEAREMGVSQARISAVQREARAATVAKPGASEAERGAKLVQERINDGRLIDPPQDSAFFHLSALRASNPADAALAADALSAKLLERSRTSLADGKLDEAERHAIAARQLGLNLPDVQAIEASIVAARRPQPPAPVQVAADKLKRTRYVAPEYPRQALAKDLSGDVRVRYTIGIDGRVKDAAVTASNPAGVFDEVALAAVRRWRFKPYEVDGQPVEAVTGTVMVFNPGDDSTP
jgi:TonB family protein